MPGYLKGIYGNAWGDELETKIIAECYKLRIHVFEKLSINHELTIIEKTVYAPMELENPMDVYVIFRNMIEKGQNNHYDLLKPLKSLIDIPNSCNLSESYASENKKLKISHLKDFKDFEDFIVINSNNEQSGKKNQKNVDDDYHIMKKYSKNYGYYNDLKKEDLDLDNDNDDLTKENQKDNLMK